ncbi:flavodoxin-dependent (E)-4-hydroxy-3-methylbut-2-enyl-diphosphate synthase [Eubacteriales bacterium OttesenSCG-928-K08]|nr:flavodoxin-dependent (E)-4-hydroxy-3-methylbut-2-enyl-diphosphate synthase [Eubacteriales bacterium OttesenSCG-928-K08]
MTKKVCVGKVPIGGGAPVTIQSMTNTETRDVEATVSQILALEEAGCEIIRLSVYDMDCARALPRIKQKIHIPLVADIHFDYRLAIAAAENGADKLRINPGNIGGESRVRALCQCAKAHKLAIRVGVNGGSLESDLLRKYGGPTPEAMVESALSHVRLLENEGFFDIVISLKASNVKNTVEAYRLIQKQVDYPLHIGVTEAGLGEDALVKSAAGLGALLLDDIGDTMRVSITGDPVQEIFAAKSILKALNIRHEGVQIVSCPTCGRCNVQLEEIVQRVQKELPQKGKPITVAVMGCAVNGPGEAKEADVGIAFGKDNGVLFKNGEQFASGDAEAMIRLLIKEANSLVGGTF